jgi:hypothetical protein
MVIFALIAIATSDPVAVHATQTIGYYATIAECHVDRNRIQPSITKGLVKLDCIPIKVTKDE